MLQIDALPRTASDRSTTVARSFEGEQHKEKTQTKVVVVGGSNVPGRV